MEFSSKKRIRRKPSDTQRTTVNAVEAAENEHGGLVTAKEVLPKVKAGTRLKTLENRLNEYTRRGWLNIVVDTRRDTASKFGVADAWIDLIDALYSGHVKVKTRNTDRLGTCEGPGCTTVGRLIYYQGLRLCSQCLNPEYTFQAGDDTHLLVKSNWRL